MTIWIASYIAYAAIMLAAIEELTVDKRLKNVVINSSDFESNRGVRCLRV